MAIKLELILAVCIAYFGSAFVQPQNQIADQAVTEDRNGISLQILKQELLRQRQVFDTMREELQTAQNINTNKKRHFYEKSNLNENIIMAKRETNTDNEMTDIQGRAITGSYIDEKGFYREKPEVENFRYDRVHVYRGLLICAQERLTLCRAFLEDVIIDWEILQDEGITVNEFDRLVNNMEKRVNEEIASVDTIMQVDPRTAKILQPVNQSSIDEISSHFQGLINCLEEQKPEQYARDRFEDMISRTKIANGELIATFHNVTTCIDDIKRKYNV